MKAFYVFLLLLSVAASVECRKGDKASPEINYSATKCRAHAVSVTKFGAAGDGVTVNTKAFKAAVEYLAKYASDGGGLLYVPEGRYVTGSFNVTSNFTLYLHKDAVLLGSPNMEDWPLIPPLPSYGEGRDAPGERHSSLIMGYNLTDVIITGDNGTIDGQGEPWWKKYRAGELNYTRGYLLEILYTDQLLVSNLTFVNSPSWNIHPTYSSNVIVSGVTVIAPIDSPNTDGIDPDSCSNVLIQDSYVISGDDCIAIKSGWDDFGIAVGMPSQHISIKRFTCVSPDSAVIALGSEMSGGIKDVRAEDLTAVNSQVGIRIKTAIGRGAYVKDIFVRGFRMYTMKWVFRMEGNYGSHPGGKFNPKAIPVIANISCSDFYAENVTMAGRLGGIEGAPFTGICISNATFDVVKSNELIWNCTNVSGSVSGVTPPACKALVDKGADAAPCSFPKEKLPIENVPFHQCTVRVES